MRSAALRLLSVAACGLSTLGGPRGGHVMYEPLLQREVMRKNLEWFLRWIPPDAPAGATAAAP